MTEAVTPGVRLVTTLAVLAVAVVAAVVSYEHMRALAEAAGEGWRSWLIPVSVDGLMVAASMTALTRRRAGQPVGALAWCALLLGIAASVTANVAAAEPTVIGRAVASWPPLALGLSFELLLQQGRRQEPASSGVVAPAIEVALAPESPPEPAPKPVPKPRLNGDLDAAVAEWADTFKAEGGRVTRRAVQDQFHVGSERASALARRYR